MIADREERQGHRPSTTEAASASLKQKAPPSLIAAPSPLHILENTVRERLAVVETSSSSSVAARLGRRRLERR